MPFTPELNLELPNNGDYEDVWDGPVNSNWEKISAEFAADGPYDGPPGPGHSHDGTIGEGPQVRHQDLQDAGSTTHSDLDTESGKVLVSSGDTTVDYLLNQLQAGSGIILTKINPGADEVVEIEASGVTPTLGDANDPSGEYGWKHFVPTSAPVAYTDNFNYPSGMRLVNCDYAVDVLTPGGARFDFRSTGYSARTAVDTKLGGDPNGQYAATVACHIPHGRAQRTTLSITEVDYSDLEVGDSVTFTLAVHSTHQVGPLLPQKYGVILEINLVKTGSGPDTYQVSHKVWIIPDNSTQVLLFSCNHTSPDHILGCWELAIDNNGHVYHYWRRKLVYSSQTSPPNSTGPVAAYFNDLETSLAAIGDEKFGAMGFGCQYNVAFEKSFDLEFRWLSVTADSDEYYDVGVCPVFPDLFGLPDIVELPHDFLLFPPGEPGVDCCDVPFSKKMGEILQTDALGNPEVWVTGCNVMYDDASPTGAVKGYTVNTNWPGCFPCEIPDGVPNIIGPPLDWPQEGTSGYIVVHGVGPLPPYIKITSSTIGFVVVAVVWIDLWEFILKYVILDGYAGTDVDIEIYNGYTPADTYPIPAFTTITEKLPEIDSVTWLDDWSKTLIQPTSGYKFSTTINGSGFNSDAVVTSSDPAMIVTGSTYISPSQMEATVEFTFPDTRGATYDLGVTNLAQAKSVTTEVEVEYPAPVVEYVELSPDTSVATGKAATIHGNFFDVSAVLTVTNPALVANFVPTWVDVNTMTAVFDIVGLTGNAIDFDITDPDGGGFVIAPCCIIADIATPSISTVVVTPGDTYEAGRGYKYSLQVTGTNFGAPSYILLANLSVLDIYDSEGDIHTTARSPTTADGDFWVKCGDIVAVDVSVMKAGVGSDTSLAAFATLAIPTLTLNPGDLVFSDGLEPGATGTATLTPTTGFTHLTDLYVANTNIVLDPLTRVVNPADIEWDYEVAADAVEGSTVDLEFDNGDCDVSPQTHSQDIEYAAPTITSLEADFYEDVLSNTVKIRGTNFRAGAIVNLTGNLSFVSVDSITPTLMEITVDDGVPGAASIEVENLDTKVTGPEALTVLTELVPVFNSSQLDPSTEGTSTTVRIWGQNFTPPGAVYAFVGLAGVVQVLALPNYLEFTGTITAAVGNPVTLGITSTSHVHPDLDVDLVEATGGGDVVIHSVSNPTPKENSTGVEFIVEGENLDLVVTVEAEVDDADKQALEYVPSGATIPVSVSVVTKIPSTLVLSLDLEKGLAYSDYTLKLYDGGMGLLATVPAALEAQPSDDAADISKVTRAALDIGIPNTGLALWSVVIKMEGATPWLFGDVWVSAGFTITSQVFNSVTDEWTVDGTNDAGGADWELKLTRPGIPGTEWTVFRIPGGVTV